MSFLPLVRIWIAVSIFASFGGWSLSALGQLNRTGYLVFCAVVGVLLVLNSKRLAWNAPRRSFRWRQLRQRFRRPWPLCFALLALLVFLGGALYPPSTHT